jgi:hypothetical protein
MPKVNNVKGYYNDKKNYRYTVQIKDTNFTNKIIKKSFCYRDDYLHTKTEAELNANNLAEYLLEMRNKKEKSLKEYLDKIDFVDKSWT